MKKTAIIVLLAFMAGCINYSEKEIADVSKHQELLFFPNNKTPNSYRLNIVAKTDGKFNIKVLQGRVNSERKDTLDSYDLPSGTVDTLYKREWYADTLFLLYTPKTVKTGVIKLKYSID